MVRGIVIPACVDWNVLVWLCFTLLCCMYQMLTWTWEGRFVCPSSTPNSNGYVWNIRTHDKCICLTLFYFVVLYCTRYYCEFGRGDSSVHTARRIPMIGSVWYNRTHNKVNITLNTVILSTLHCSNITCTFHVFHRKLILKKGTTIKLVVPTFLKPLPTAASAFKQDG